MTAPRAVDAAAIPDLVAAAEMIDLQLVSPASVEVVLLRTVAELVSVALHDLLGERGVR